MSRCPVIADGLAANMSEESLGRWTVTDSNPRAVKEPALQLNPIFGTFL